jgi:2-(3-amino-3-carboxypropyl)histidine synthase
MIQNPSVAAFRYDPYSKLLSSEGYDCQRMRACRWSQVCAAASEHCLCFGLILGSLGRQGSCAIFARLKPPALILMM